MNLYQQMREKKSGIEQFSTISVPFWAKIYILEHTLIFQINKIGNSTQIYPQVYIGKNVKMAKTVLYIVVLEFMILCDW